MNWRNNCGEGGRGGSAEAECRGPGDHEACSLERVPKAPQACFLPAALGYHAHTPTYTPAGPDPHTPTVTNVPAPPKLPGVPS